MKNQIQKRKKRKKKIQLKKGEIIRINSVDKKMDNTRENIFEFTLLKFCGEILSSINARNDKICVLYLYDYPVEKGNNY